MAVTSESFGICYGRTADARTSCAARDVIGRFPSDEAAQAAMVSIAKVKDSYREAIKEARRALSTLEEKCDAAVRRAAQGAVDAPNSVSPSMGSLDAVRSAK